MADETRTESSNVLRTRKRHPHEIHSGATRIRNVYVAHNFSAAIWVRFNVVPKLRRANINVVSTWHDLDPTDPALHEGAGARMCIADLEHANILLIFADQFGSMPGRGKYVEFGYSIAKGKHIIVVVERADDMNCVFYYHPFSKVLASFEDALEVIQNI